jgi:3,5-epimerase/4-reductase
MQHKFLVFGHTGWIGSQLVKLLQAEGYIVFEAKSRLENLPSIIEELQTLNPDFVLNAAGITGKPNVDWCESHKEITYLINVIGVANLAYACSLQGIHLTNYSSGCIYHFTEDSFNLLGDLVTKGQYSFSEWDEPNFTGSTYSKSKIASEKALEGFSNVLTLRLRMPITNWTDPKSLITKLAKYDYVVDQHNSGTYLPEMLPISIDMTLKRLKGVYNFTNPGTITHPEILELYKEFVNPEHTWNIMTEDEQNGKLAAKRSVCELDVTKLCNLYEIRDIKEAVRGVFTSACSCSK